MKDTPVNIDPANIDPAFWRDDLDERPVMVSIYCITYNHEKFLAQALEGFVMQQTNFRLEAIVHDDCSTDGTAEVLRQYAEKYPSIIKPIYEKENLYSRHDGSLGRLMRAHMRGKYIAMCEGDDYWTDPNKLQMQVDFLEANPDYSMCFHNCIEHWEGGEMSDSERSLQVRDYTGPQLYDDYDAQTATMVFRLSVFKSKPYLEICRYPIFSGDMAIIMACAKEGKIRCITTESLSVYRRHQGGVMFSLIRGNCYRAVSDKQYFLRVFGEEYAHLIKPYIAEFGVLAFYQKIKQREFVKALKALALVVRYTPTKLIPSIISTLRKHHMIVTKRI